MQVCAIITPEMNCCTVHRTVQQMDALLQHYNNEIKISSLAEKFQVTADRLLLPISILNALHYIEFTDKVQDNIYLTTAGRYTLVP